MSIVTVQEAEKHLSRLIQDARLGDEIILTEDSLPVAKIVSLLPTGEQPTIRRKAGSGRGLFRMAPDFDTPLEDFNEYMG